MTELIVNGVVIANGIEDSDGDILTKKDIKTIFTKYQRDTDVMHKNIKADGVEVFASWISEIDSVIKGKSVPAGSWIATLKVTNQRIIECIQKGKLNGFSLGSVSKEAMTPNYWFINKSLTYQDMKDIEDVIPLFISFVDKPANQYEFEVMTYDAYINKNQKDVEEMTENTDEMISVSALERIRGLFINKAEDEAVAEEETVTEEASADETVSALFEKLDMIIEQNTQILEAINKETEEEKDASEEENVDEEIEKAEEEKEEDEKSSEETSEEETEEEKEKAEESSEETTEEEKEDDEEKDVNIDKRQTSMIENQSTEKHTTFYQKTGRDAFGRKIKH